MKIDIDIEISDQATTCRFGRKCMEGFDSSLCCDIVRADSNYLFVTPASTFKSANCTYIREMEKEEKKAHICTCPIRLAIFRQYNL